MQSVWLTGGQSFTAKHLLPVLQKAGYQVDTTPVDVTDLQACQAFVDARRPEFIIHLAAISFVPAGNDADVYRVNTLGTENLLKAATRHPPQKIILASTSHIYGRQSLASISEQVPPSPVSHYGCSKLAMEYLAANYQQQCPIQIVRPFNYTGHGQATQFLIPKLISHFADRAESINLGNIDVWRDISDVRWVAEVYSRLLKAPLQGPINICRGEALSLRSVITDLQQLTGHPIRIIQDPALMRDNELPKQCGDASLLHTILPDIVPPPLHDTLQWMLAKHGHKAAS